MRWSRHAWWLYLALMAPLSVAYLAGPLNAGPVFNVIGFSACVAIVLGVRINRPGTRWAWYLIALGQLLFVFGDVIAVSVNVSARQMQRVEIVDEVRNALRSSGLEPSCLVLEIIESLMISDVDLAIERLGALRKLGVRVALDDFGTGFSSLNYMRRLPINVLKIDKHFIDGVDGNDKDSELTAAIIDLARVMDLDCVAEGVERPEQQERLKQLGCGYAQGFLLARPMRPAALQQLLQTPAHALISAG